MTKKERQRYIKSTFDGVFRKKSQHPFLQNAQEIVKNYGAFCIKLLYLQTKHFPKAALLKKKQKQLFCLLCMWFFNCCFLYFFNFLLPVSFLNQTNWSQIEFVQWRYLHGRDQEMQNPQSKAAFRRDPVLWLFLSDPGFFIVIPAFSFWSRFVLFSLRC